MPAAFAGAERGCVDELESAEQFGRNGILTSALGTALQGLEPVRGSTEVDVPGTDGQGFGNPGAGVVERERKGLVGKPRHPGGGHEET